MSLGRAQPLNSSPLTPKLGPCCFACEGGNEKGTHDFSKGVYWGIDSAMS